MADWKKLIDEYQGEFLWHLNENELFQAAEVGEVSSNWKKNFLFRKEIF